MKKTLYFSLIATLAILVSGGVAQGQIVGQIVANIPFSFYVGDAKLPPGEYHIRLEDPQNNSGLMEISNASGTESVLFDTLQAQSNTAPSTTELVFDHLGNRYYLRKLFDRDDKYGATALDAGYSKLHKEMSQHPQETHISASRRPLPSTSH